MLAVYFSPPSPLQCLVDALMLALVIDHLLQAVFKVFRNTGFALSAPSALNVTCYL